jgi:hypothetical protein
VFSGHFYHATTRKVVAVFGTLFNNISVVRKDAAGKVVNIIRVPLAYGPKQKFLARLDEQPNLDAAKVAIKLPRMSFEIFSLTYDTTTKTNRNNILTAPNSADGTKQLAVRNYAPYRMGIQLSIMAKNQDDALQILEQILPNFQPEYTVTIKDLEEMNVTTDMPFVLTGVQMNEDYEGDFLQRRAIIYTLEFETRLRFYGPVSKRAIIKTAMANINGSISGTERVTVQVDPLNAQPTDNYTVTTSIDFIESSDKFNLTMQSGTGSYVAGETVTDSSTGTTAKVTSFTNNVLAVAYADGVFHIGDTIVGGTSGCSRTVGSVEQVVVLSPLDP